MENVKALVQKKFKPHFVEWLKQLEELGYSTYWQVLNATEYGMPQNRERVIAVSIFERYRRVRVSETDTAGIEAERPSRTGGRPKILHQSRRNTVAVGE